MKKNYVKPEATITGASMNLEVMAHSWNPGGGKALVNRRRMDFEKIHINFDTSPIKPNSTYSLIVENGEDGWLNANGYTLEN